MCMDMCMCMCVFVGERKKSREKEDVFEIKNDIKRLLPIHYPLLFSICHSLFFIPSFLHFINFSSLHPHIFLPERGPTLLLPYGGSDNIREALQRRS